MCSSDLMNQHTETIYAGETVLARDLEIPEAMSDHFTFDIPLEAIRNGELVIRFERADGSAVAGGTSACLEPMGELNATAFVAAQGRNLAKVGKAIAETLREAWRGARLYRVFLPPPPPGTRGRLPDRQYRLVTRDGAELVWGHAVGAEGRAVGLGGVVGVGRAVGDVGPRDDERGARLLGDCLVEGGADLTLGYAELAPG